MSYVQYQKSKGLPRELVKWMQGLELTFYPKNVRWDLSNGFLVAEMFSRYYPQDFPEFAYDRGTSLCAKQRNWTRLERSLQKKNLQLTKEVVDGTIHCKPGAAELLVQEVFGILTHKTVRDMDSRDLDFTDRKYQDMLPPLYRSTACNAIKNNLKTTEIIATPDINTNRRKAEIILHRHMESKAWERARNPGRYKAKAKRGKKHMSQGDERYDSCSSGATNSTLCRYCNVRRRCKVVGQVLSK